MAVLAGLIPIASTVAAEVALLFVTIVCVALIAYEYLRHREARALIRNQGGTAS